VRLAHNGCKRFLWSWWYRRLFLSVIPVLERSLRKPSGAHNFEGILVTNTSDVITFCEMIVPETADPPKPLFTLIPVRPGVTVSSVSAP
jgi:hypothetical protein